MLRFAFKLKKVVRESFLTKRAGILVEMKLQKLK